MAHINIGIGKKQFPFNDFNSHFGIHLNGFEMSPTRNVLRRKPHQAPNALGTFLNYFACLCFVID